VRPMAKVLRTVVAGRLRCAVLYDRCAPTDSPRARAEKQRASSTARQAINLRTSCQRLECLLFANFGRNDWLVTLTYDEEHLPAGRDGAVKQVKKFIRTLREHRRPRGQPLRYVYVTEDKHGEGRIHHHMVVNGTGEDMEPVRSLWGNGIVLMQNLRPREFPALVRYLTKEPREYGRVDVGARNWSASRGLAKAVAPPAETVPDILTLQAPPGSYILENEGTTVNEFGNYQFIKYLMPDQEDYQVPLEVSTDPDLDLTPWRYSPERRKRKTA